MNRFFWVSLFLTLIISLMVLTVVFVEDPPNNPSKLISYSSETGQNLRKLEWDGHLWISLNSQGIVHHPDCPCLKKDFEKPE